MTTTKRNQKAERTRLDVPFESAAQLALLRERARQQGIKPATFARIKLLKAIGWKHEPQTAAA